MNRQDTNFAFAGRATHLLRSDDHFIFQTERCMAGLDAEIAVDKNGDRTRVEF